MLPVICHGTSELHICICNCARKKLGTAYSILAVSVNFLPGHTPFASLLKLSPWHRGPIDGDQIRRLKLALAAALTASNVTTDSRDITFVEATYHVINIATDSGLLVSLCSVCISRRWQNAHGPFPSIMHMHEGLLAAVAEAQASAVAPALLHRITCTAGQVSGTLTDCPGTGRCTAEVTLSIQSSSAPAHQVAVAAYHALTTGLFQVGHVLMSGPPLTASTQHMTYAHLHGCDYTASWSVGQVL